MGHIVCHTEMHHRTWGLLFRKSRKWYPMFCHSKPSSQVIKLVYVSTSWVLFSYVGIAQNVMETSHNCYLCQQTNNFPYLMLNIFQWRNQIKHHQHQHPPPPKKKKKKKHPPPKKKKKKKPKQTNNKHKTLISLWNWKFYSRVASLLILEKFHGVWERFSLLDWIFRLLYSYYHFMVLSLSFI